MGRWLKMRSSRRPPPVDATLMQGAASSLTADVQLVETGAKGITRIDIGQLMDAVNTVGRGPRLRQRFAADIALDLGPGHPSDSGNMPGKDALNALPDQTEPASSAKQPGPGASLREALTGPYPEPAPSLRLRATLRRVLDRLPGLGDRQG